jgi:hypothetical protein
MECGATRARPRSTGRAIHFQVVVGLAIAGVLEVLRAGIESQQPLEQVVVHRQCNDGAPGSVSSGDVAVLQEVVQDRSRLAACINRTTAIGLALGCLELVRTQP